MRITKKEKKSKKFIYGWRKAHALRRRKEVIKQEEEVRSEARRRETAAVWQSVWLFVFVGMCIDAAIITDYIMENYS